MDWFIQVIVFGSLAFLFFVLSMWLRHNEKFGAGLILGALELISAAISSSAWVWALKVSGKTDWFLFGILGYTPFAIIFYAMFVVGVWCMVTNARGLSKRKSNANPAA